MRAVLHHGPRDIRVETVPDPVLLEPTDAIVRVTLSCICGSDLWPYRRQDAPEHAHRIGHEFLGVVEEVGADVRTLAVGDLVIAPFMYSCGDCEFCRAGLQTSCVRGGFYGSESIGGGQGQVVRVPLADGTLVAAPVGEDDPRLPALLTLSDVMATGHHAAVSAGVGAGSHVVVIGDGAVGLCGVLAAHRLGAERITLLSTHEDRAAIGRRFGATEVIAERGEAAVAAVLERTDGLGAPHVMECVGMQGSWDTAVRIARPGGTIGYVGVPNGVDEGLDLSVLFRRNVTVRGGVAPARAYLPELLADVLDGTIDPSPVFDLELSLEEAPEGYAAMDQRRATKVLLRP
ncbi:zinc-dependent alcohol dehydrogenase family protein [Actinotalea sp. M2MS4P-6]|uniref:zinc-dependent alcohol dehydrogenase family protein n=1 Tax=Actinotalea sp. M2MS4P-6 TaxID=2983762 RepID=UPI0021E3964B|nr:zinc-dependent alcohol dehydrogenase family protein [Actinotalea sp. M2MS4P-6]MCV2395309.1 zinc-dependent alcohol dehydrogenase family protein [Actinotalea sp. M2MS4P-6]